MARIALICASAPASLCTNAATLKSTPGKVWIGAEMIADHDAAFGCKLRENALQSFRAERRTRERGG